VLGIARRNSEALAKELQGTRRDSQIGWIEILTE